MSATASAAENSTVNAAEGLRLPDGACDCHVHVIGNSSLNPMHAGRAYTPGPASVADLQAHLRRLGLQRAVIVQPSVYGHDDRCLLDALDRMQGAARGVAVPDEDVTASGLRELHAHGVRAVRVNVESESSHGANLRDAVSRMLARWSGRIADLGWHLQCYASSGLIAQLADDLVRLPTPVVLDHFALVTTAPAQDDRQMLPQLLRSGRVAVKCSAPYRLPDPSIATAWAKALVAAAPDAVVWASDWPHTGRTPGAPPHQVSPYRPVSSESLRQGVQDWFGAGDLLHRVLVTNPARLYGF